MPRKSSVSGKAKKQTTRTKRSRVQDDLFPGQLGWKHIRIFGVTALKLRHLGTDETDPEKIDRAVNRLLGIPDDQREF
ncbi:MAG: hypothetical protein IJR99_01330 [Kiritimatiellae bacterium]|nr:hypothetical protein [Kiritimatiellia bacterium]